MAICLRCASDKLSEQPCPRCGSRANAPETVTLVDGSVVPYRAALLAIDWINRDLFGHPVVP